MSESLESFKAWSTGRKLAFGAGIVAIVVAVTALGLWAYRTPKGVLFADLAERDAAVITAELDKLKQPYDIGEDGRSIYVAADKVHRTRMSLMGKQLPLNGVVGFEVFNHADFGVSDFVQKINYQRALQGELTRTILALEQVQDARVHLALPDQTVFRKDAQKAKASVTLSMRGGQSLQPGQVAGIQRLVAASVPEVRSEDVTVLDQHGVVLSRAQGEEAAPAAGQLDARQAMEAHLTRKAQALLNQLFAPGETLVAVDVVLNHQQTRVTTEEVLGGTAERGQQVAGVITRERTVSKDAPGGDSGGNAAAAQVTTQETDYLPGKRTEQTVSAGGQIARLNVAVVVKRSLPEAELARLRQLLATAVGFQPARGDGIAVHALSDVVSAQAVPEPTLAPARPSAPSEAIPPQRATVAPAAATASSALVWLALLAGAALLAVLALAWQRTRARQAPTLNATEREAVLRSVQQWLSAGSQRA
jgi:flagellar M-ring protein FliF